MNKKFDKLELVEFMVYPLGFEPRIDGVGGRNVIQLHYEYVCSFSNHRALPMAKEIENFRRTAVDAYRYPITTPVRILFTLLFYLFFLTFASVSMLYFSLFMKILREKRFFLCFFPIPML